MKSLPTFSVTSMRPSGRNAMRQGRSNSAIFSTLNGGAGVGGSVPALICASPARRR